MFLEVPSNIIHNFNLSLICYFSRLLVQLNLLNTNNLNVNYGDAVVTHAVSHSYRILLANP